MNNPIKNFTKKEWILWIASLFIVIISNLLTADFDPLTLLAALVCVTSMIFAANDIYSLSCGRWLPWKTRHTSPL